MKSKATRLLPLSLAAGAAAVTVAAYRRDLKAAKRRVVSRSQTFDGTIEFAQSGVDDGLETPRREAAAQFSLDNVVAQHAAMLESVGS